MMETLMPRPRRWRTIRAYAEKW